MLGILPRQEHLRACAS